MQLLTKIYGYAAFKHLCPGESMNENMKCKCKETPDVQNRYCVLNHHLVTIFYCFIMTEGKRVQTYPPTWLESILFGCFVFCLG